MNILEPNDSLSANEVDTVNLTFNTIGLQNGTYPNLLEVYTNDPNNPDNSIKILMEVGDYPSIDVITDTLKFLLKSDEEKIIPLTIRNKGKLNLEYRVNWTYYSPWIKPSPDNGTIAPNNETNVNIKVNVNDVDTTYAEGIIIINSNDPNFSSINIPVIVKIETATDIENANDNLPTEFVLEQNYPNPFNPTTTIKYSIPVGNKNIHSVHLKVYNVLGKEITTLVNKEQSAGNYSVVFDAKDLPSGVYIYSIKAGVFTSSKKFVLMK